MASRVLITQGTRPFAQRLGKLLQAEHTVQFGSAEEIPFVLLQTGRYVQFPGISTGAFEHGLLRICLDNSIDVLIPLGEEEIDLLVRAKQLFAEYGIAIWGPDAADPGQLTLIKNPGRHLPLLVFDHGIAVVGETGSEQPSTLSGVFTPLASGELALCCIAD